MCLMAWKTLAGHLHVHPTLAGRESTSLLSYHRWAMCFSPLVHVVLSQTVQWESCETCCWVPDEGLSLEWPGQVARRQWVGMGLFLGQSFSSQHPKHLSVLLQDVDGPGCFLRFLKPCLNLQIYNLVKEVYLLVSCGLQSGIHSSCLVLLFLGWCLSRNVCSTLDAWWCRPTALNSCSVTVAGA